MRKSILFLFFFLCITFHIFALDFDLVLTKEGESRVYFSDNAGNDLYNRVSLYTSVNTEPVSATFYFGYELYPNLVELVTDKLTMTLTFTSDPSENGKSFMLVKQNDENTGLVYDYSVSESVKNIENTYSFDSVGKIASKTFDDYQRSSAQELSERKVAVFSKREIKDPIIGMHEVEITINPPSISSDNPTGSSDNTSSEAFTTGQYIGYVILLLEINS